MINSINTIDEISNYPWCLQHAVHYQIPTDKSLYTKVIIFDYKSCSLRDTMGNTIILFETKTNEIKIVPQKIKKKCFILKLMV